MQVLHSDVPDWSPVKAIFKGVNPRSITYRIAEVCSCAASFGCHLPIKLADSADSNRVNC